MRRALGSMERHIEVIQERGRERHLEEGRLMGIMDGYDLGHRDAVRDFQVTYTCRLCQKPVVLRTEGEDTVAATTFLTRCGWSHAECE
jgi:hypothetical protein